MAIDLAKYSDIRLCNLCGLTHSYQKRCGALSPGYDLKQGIGKCPHCRTNYVGDTTEPVQVYVPWEQRKVWESCWNCFIKKLEG